jgi:hypothetical protein
MKMFMFAALLLALGGVSGARAGERGAQSSVTFTVACFDAGAAALQGRPGVLSVQKGWQDGREVNRVVFDPQKVSVPSMEGWLKGAGTFIGSGTETRQNH